MAAIGALVILFWIGVAALIGPVAALALFGIGFVICRCLPD